MVKRLVDHFDPEQIILFGSHAREQPGRIVTLTSWSSCPSLAPSAPSRSRCAWALHDIRAPKDIILATPDEVARRRNIVETVIRPALREGKVLYVRTR